MVSTPTSVMTSTARSSRSPLASACATVIRGAGRRHAPVHRRAASQHLIVDDRVDLRCAQQPSAVTTRSSRSPAPSRRTFAACLTLGAVELDDVADLGGRQPVDVDEEKRCGQVLPQRPLNASRMRPRRSQCGRALKAPSGELLATQARQLAHQLFLLRIEFRRAS